MKIFIKDLRLYGYHGVREQEKKNGQYFIFNISIYIDDHGLEHSDSLEDTISYSDVAAEVKRINKTSRSDLLETLSRKIASHIAEMSGLVNKVEVTVEKPHPPMDEKLGSVGVEYTLSRKKIDPDREEGSEVYISLGSNMGDRERNLKKALESLERDPRVEVINSSSVYRTEPLYQSQQEEFYNMTARLRVSTDPFSLLGLIKGIEHNMGRRAGEKRYGPRPIDIDILFFGDRDIQSDILEIPHPGIRERKFVLMPLAEIAPGLEIEGMNITQYLNKSHLPGKVDIIK